MNKDSALAAAEKALVLAADNSCFRQKAAVFDIKMNNEDKARFLREAQTASALNHPHICTIHEVGEEEGKPYIAIEYVSGLPLSYPPKPK